MGQGLQPCLEPRCPTLVKSGRCSAHQPDKSKGYGHAGGERIRGRKLQDIRRRLFEAEPFCRSCAEQGRQMLATIVDHIVPLAEGGQDVDSNRQPLCDDCHDVKTRAETARGVQRW